MSESEYSSVDDYEPDDECILKIDINNAASHRTIYTAKRATTSNFRGRLNYEEENLDIVASTVYEDDDGMNLRIVKKSGKENRKEKDGSIHERWVHLKTNSIRFEDFERLVINTLLQHHDELIPVAMYLLRKVRDNFEEASAYGSYIKPGTTLRCDGMDRNNRDKPDLSAIFVSIPYFDIGKWRPPNAPKDGSLHLPRGLFQSFYTQEAAIDRDGEQMFRNFKGINADEYLRVPQLWTLALNSKIIITCGPSSLYSTFDDHIDFVDEKDLLVQGPSLVQITDFQKRVTYLPIERCSTFLSLRQSIATDCLPDLGVDINDCVLRVEDDEDVLKASEWPRILKTQRSVFIRVQISRKVVEIIEPLDEGHLVEYAALSSDDDDDDDRMALIVRDQRPKDTHESHAVLSRKAEAARERLALQGYVVNKTASLEPEKNHVIGSTKPKIFQRPSTVSSESSILYMIEKSEDGPSDGEIQEDKGYETGGNNEDTAGDVRVAATVDSESSRSYIIERSEDGSYDGEIHEDEGYEARGSTEDTASDLRVAVTTEDSKHSSEASLHISRDHDQATAKYSSINDTAGSQLQSEDSTPELPRMTRAETFQPTVESDDEEPQSYSDVDAWIHTLPEGNRASTPDGTGESKDNDGPSLAKNTDENRESGDPKNTKSPGESEADSLRQVVKEEPTAALKREDDKGTEEEIQKRLEETMRKKLAGFGFQANQIEAIMDPDTYFEADEKIVEEMRKRLALFGFQDNQIQAIIYPDRQKLFQSGTAPANPSQPPPQPTYVKAHKQHIDIRTLQYYDIPYEFDRMDPNYIIILREMSQTETEILFEHSRRLRSADDPRAGTDPVVIVPKPEWKEIHPKRKAKRHSSEYVVGRKEGFFPAPGTKSKVETIRISRSEVVQQATVIREEPGKPSTLAQEDIKPNLKIPPFLAWPTTMLNEGENPTVEPKNTGPAAHQNSDEDLAQLTLAAIAKKISKPKKDPSDIPISKFHPFLARYKAGKAFTNIKELTMIDLASKTGVGTPSSEHDKYKMLMEIGGDSTFFQKLLRGDTANDQQVKPTGVGSSGRSKEKVSANTQCRRVIEWQLVTLLSERDSFLSATQQLIDQFVPNHYPHALLRKCWGSLDAINEAIMDLCAKNEACRQQEVANDHTLIYVIKDVPSPDYLRKHQLEGLKIAINPCTVCGRGAQYPDIDDAYEHLHRFHDDEKEGITPAQRKRLGHWLVTTLGLEAERNNADMLKLMQTLHQRTSRLLVKSIEIRNSVSNESDEKDQRYLLPSALVKAAMKTFQFIYTAPYTVQYLRDRNQTAGGGIEVQDNLALADHYGSLADNQLSRAQSELLLMAHTGSPDGAKIIRYVASTPETTTLFSILCLVMKNVYQNKSIYDLYRSHLSTLRYNAIKNPSKRIFRSVFLLEEELSIVSATLTQQYTALTTLLQLLNHRSYRITTQTRISAHRNLERPAYDAFQSAYTASQRHIRTLQTQLTKTSQVLRYNLEIAEEGQSKAILVFTLVTIIFLPLSFVAGLFGMNTKGIRDMERDQTIFWAVALPLTALIGGISLVVAYGKVGERLDKLGRNIKEKKGYGPYGGRGSSAASKMGRRRDEEGGEEALEMDKGDEPVKVARRETAKKATVSQVHAPKRRRRDRPLSRHRSSSEISYA